MRRRKLEIKKSGLKGRGHKKVAGFPVQRNGGGKSWCGDTWPMVERWMRRDVMSGR